jgi:hypothetical protein
MKTQKSFKKFFAIAFLSGAAALVPQFAHSEVKAVFEGEMPFNDTNYLNTLKENLKTIENTDGYKNALKDLKGSVSACTSSQDWIKSNPDTSANLIVTVVTEDGNQGSTGGAVYSVSLSVPDVTQDSYRQSVKIVNNLSQYVSESELYETAIKRMRTMAVLNKAVCTRRANEETDPSQKISSN